MEPFQYEEGEQRSISLIDDVKFIMWNGGKHWYAKIGKLDVVVNGIQKWNTKEEATKAAKQYINENWK